MKRGKTAAYRAEIKVTIEKLQLEPGDILVLTFPPEAEIEGAKAFANTISSLLPDGVQILCADGKVGMGVLKPSKQKIIVPH
jgi:hypothetical protein